MGVVSKNAINLDFTRPTSNNAASSITNNINVITRESTSEPIIENPSEIPENNTVSANPDNSVYIQQIDELTRANTALRMILDINKANPFIVNDFIVTSSDKLSDLIMVLTKADSVEIQTDEFIVGCITKNNYRKILHIYVSANGNTEEFKYYYGDANKLLHDEKISIKYVY